MFRNKNKTVTECNSAPTEQWSNLSKDVYVRIIYLDIKLTEFHTSGNLLLDLSQERKTSLYLQSQTVEGSSVLVIKEKERKKDCFHALKKYKYVFSLLYL